VCNTEGTPERFVTNDSEHEQQEELSGPLGRTMPHKKEGREMSTKEDWDQAQAAAKGVELLRAFLKYPPRPHESPASNPRISINLNVILVCIVVAEEPDGLVSLRELSYSSPYASHSAAASTSSFVMNGASSSIGEDMVILVQNAHACL
jgi:hypothetical protein